MRPKANIIAPGKVMLIGEYAVLEGASAVVMAVDRHVVLYPSKSPATGLVAFARERAAMALGLDASAEGFEADSRAFYDGSAKLGLGSSAAVCVASVASLFFQAGRDIYEDATRRDIFRLAFEAHNAFQGERGSGADVAASCLGGTLVVEMGNPKGQWNPPVPIRLVFLWSGHVASTPALVQAVRESHKVARDQYAMLVARMAEAADGFVAASNLTQLLACIAEYGALMAELGKHAGVPIVTEEMAQVIALARRSGGAAKPSGAGGGDIMVAAFEPDADVLPFLAQAGKMGMVPLCLAQDRQGVRITTGRGA